MTRIRVLTGCVLAVLATLVGTAAPAGAVDQDVATCLASGGFNNSPVGPVPGSMSFSGYLTLDCVTVGTGDDGGVWNLAFSGFSSLESCAAGTGVGSVTGSSAFDGAVTSGSFNYVHAGLNIAVAGTLYTANDGNRAHLFTAELVFLPTLSCPSSGGGASLTGVAHIADLVEGPSVTVGAAACTFSGEEHYFPPLDLTPFTRGVDVLLHLDCIGLYPAAGPWNMILQGSTTGNCAVEAGSASVVASSVPTGTVGGGMNWVRGGPYMGVAATFSNSTASFVFSGAAGYVTLPQCLSGSPVGQFSGVGVMTAL